MPRAALLIVLGIAFVVPGRDICFAQSAGDCGAYEHGKRNAKTVYLTTSIDPAAGDKIFREAFTSELRRVGLEVISDAAATDVHLDVTAEAYQVSAANPVKRKTDSKSPQQKPAESVVDSFSVRFRASLTAPWLATRPWSSTGTLGVSGSQEKALTALGDNLGRRIRTYLRPGMSAVERINVSVAGNDEWSVKLRDKLPQALRRWDFTVTDRDEADAWLVIVLNTSPSAKGLEFNYMYEVFGGKYTGMETITTGGGRALAVNDNANAKLDEVAGKLAADLHARNRKG